MCTHFFLFVLYDLCWPNESELEILLFGSNRQCPPAVHVASFVANAMRLHRPLVPQRPHVAAHATRHVASASVALTRRNKDLGWRPAKAQWLLSVLFVSSTVCRLCTTVHSTDKSATLSLARRCTRTLSWYDELGAGGDDIAPTAKGECSHTSSE